MPRTRFATKAGLIVAALAVQGVVLSAGWFMTFRVVQRSFAQVIQDRTIEQTQEYADRIASLIPEDATKMPVFGSPEWQKLQNFIKRDAFQELPDGGFACVIEPDGHILCHPELEESPGLRNFSFAGKNLLSGLGPTAESENLLGAGGDSSAGGVVEFGGGDFHYVATKPLPGSDLRLLIHQPVGALVSVGAESTRFVMGAAGLAVLVVLGVTGTGLSFLLRRYESTHVELNRQLHENLALAKRIQEGTLPTTLPPLDGYAVAGWSRPAEETGGDTFDVVALPGRDGEVCRIDASQNADSPGCIAFLLADATGHGVGPALAITQLNAMTRLAWRMGGSLLDVARLVNEQLDTRLPEGRFVTAVFGVLDTKAHTIELVSAGQGPLLVWRSGSASLESIDSNTYPLGVMPDLGPVSTTRLTLREGDMFLAISDGIFEAMDPGKAQFGVERLERTLRETAGAHPDAVAEAIGDAVSAFTRGAPADDDRTVLIIKRTEA